MISYQDTLLNSFFLQPMTQFGVRELGRITKLDTKTVMKYLADFVRRKIVVRKKEKGKHVYYEANRKSYVYKHIKSEVLVRKVLESRVIDYLIAELSPEAIVLFGSVQKGTYHEKSDVDLFISCNYKKLNLSRFNKKIGHNISILFEKNIKTLSTGLLENIYNGLTLYGKLEIIK